MPGQSKRAACLPAVLAYLRMGKGQDESARLAGVNRWTLTRWLREPAVRRKVRAARREGERLVFNRVDALWRQEHEAFMASVLRRERPGE